MPCNVQTKKVRQKYFVVIGNLAMSSRIPSNLRYQNTSEAHRSRVSATTTLCQSQSPIHLELWSYQHNSSKALRSTLVLEICLQIVMNHDHCHELYSVEHSRAKENTDHFCANNIVDRLIPYCPVHTEKLRLEEITIELQYIVSWGLLTA